MSSPWRGPAASPPPKPPAAARAAEERVEEVGDRAEAVEVRREAAGAQALVAVAVVGRAALGVVEDLVGLGGLLELLLGVGVVAVDVGVQLAGELAERLLDRGLVGVAADAEDLVGVAGPVAIVASALVDVLDEARELAARPRARCGSRRRSPCGPGR